MAKLSRDLSNGTLHPRENITGSGALGALNADDPGKNPWCGDFVETCIRIGLPDEPLLDALGQNPYWARNWLLFGQDTKPVTGAVLIFERGSGGHVGLAVGQVDALFIVLGGSQSDSVTVVRVA